MPGCNKICTKLTGYLLSRNSVISCSLCNSLPLNPRRTKSHMSCKQKSKDLPYLWQQVTTRRKSDHSSLVSNNNGNLHITVIKLPAIFRKQWNVCHFNPYVFTILSIERLFKSCIIKVVTNLDYSPAFSYSYERTCYVSCYMFFCRRTKY